MYTWHGSGKTYTKKALVPLWIAQCIFLFVVICGLGYMMLELAGRPEWGGVPPVASAIMAFLIITLLLEPLEMVFQSYRILEPWLYLAFQIYKALFGTILLAGGIYVVAQGSLTITLASLVVIVFVVIIGLMALSFYASLVYAAIIMRGHRKSTGYRSVKRQEKRDGESC